jgi:AcrR family transcriptional regulator
VEREQTAVSAPARFHELKWREHEQHALNDAWQQRPGRYPLSPASQPAPSAPTQRPLGLPDAPKSSDPIGKLTSDQHWYICTKRLSHVKMSSGRKKNNREALLEGALRCLEDRGYARTTARDIVAAAGTNLGAIGYHYSSTTDLLNQALEQGFRRWFEELAKIAADTGEDASPIERLARITSELPKSYERNKQFALAFIEALAQAEHSEEIRNALADSYEEGRHNTIRLLEPLIGEPDGRHARVLASVLIAIFDGGLMQWLVDPDRAPTGTDLIQTIQHLAAVSR